VELIPERKRMEQTKQESQMAPSFPPLLAKLSTAIDDYQMNKEMEPVVVPPTWSTTSFTPLSPHTPSSPSVLSLPQVLQNSPVHISTQQRQPVQRHLTFNNEPIEEKLVDLSLSLPQPISNIDPIPTHQRARKDIKQNSWLNFKFDRDAIMQCFPPLPVEVLVEDIQSEGDMEVL